VKYKSILFDQARNKIGGIVASANKDGNYFREKVTPHNPKSESQTAIRATFTANSQAWKRLTDTQRQGWIALAKQVTHTDTLGNKYQPSGQQLYVGCNGNLASLGMDPIDDAPGVPDALPDVNSLLLTATISATTPFTQVLTLTWSGGSSDTNRLIKATALFSPGRSFTGRSQYRIIESAPVSLGQTDDLLAEYQAKFGALGLGAKLAVSLTVISANGFAGPTVTTSTVVAAA
jgi:hypothetical protein